MAMDESEEEAMATEEGFPGKDAGDMIAGEEYIDEP